MRRRTDPKNTASAIDEEGWLHTGDIAEIDTCGRFLIIDRIKVRAHLCYTELYLPFLCRT
jgi:long-subunit acyl-CoA synthetase (AMP-forming)